MCTVKYYAKLTDQGQGQWPQSSNMYVIQRQFKSTSVEYRVPSSKKWTESSAYFVRVINFNTES